MKCCSLIWFNPRPKSNVALYCVSTNDQLIKSNAVTPYNWWHNLMMLVTNITKKVTKIMIRQQVKCNQFQIMNTLAFTKLTESVCTLFFVSSWLCHIVSKSSSNIFSKRAVSEYSPPSVAYEAIFVSPCQTLIRDFKFELNRWKSKGDSMNSGLMDRRSVPWPTGLGGPRNQKNIESPLV